VTVGIGHGATYFSHGDIHERNAAVLCAFVVDVDAFHLVELGGGTLGFSGAQGFDERHFHIAGACCVGSDIRIINVVGLAVDVIGFINAIETADKRFDVGVVGTAQLDPADVETGFGAVGHTRVLRDLCGVQGTGRQVTGGVGNKLVEALAAAVIRQVNGFFVRHDDRVFVCHTTQGEVLHRHRGCSSRLGDLDNIAVVIRVRESAAEIVLNALHVGIVRVAGAVGDIVPAYCVL